MALGKGLGSLIPNRVASTKTAPQHASDRLWQIPVVAIAPNPHQPRRTFTQEDLQELMDSIREHGILQPLIVTEKPDGAYELIAGERRLRASVMLGLITVPCVVRPVAEADKLELALIENIQRKNLNPMEEAFAFKRLYDEFNLTQNEIGKRVAKTPSYVSQALRLLDLPEEIQKALSDGKLTKAHAAAILGLPTAEEQIKMYRAIIGSNITGSAVREAITASGRTRHVRDPEIVAYERELREALGTKVTLTKRNGRGYIKIEFYSPEELVGLMKRLRG